MSLGDTRRGPTRPVRVHRRLLQPTTDPLCHRLQNARTSREAGGVTPVSIKSGDHHRIVERLRFLHQIHAHQTMLKFSIGDRVTFEDGQGRKVEGTLTRYNRKSVTVIGADGRHWNIAPGFLRKADQAAASKTPNIIALPKR